MGQHATMHGKTTTPSNGASGVWVPVLVNADGQLVIAPAAGELTNVNRLAGGAIVQYKAISADDLVYTGPCIFYGIKVLTAGTTISVFDNTTATGTALMSAEATTTAGAVLTPAGLGVGVLMNNGIFVDITGGTYIVYYVNA